jgi:type I restriction enzyme S subunit
MKAKFNNVILSDFIELKHGYQFRDSDFTENGIPIIKIGNVWEKGLSLENVSFISKSRLEIFKNFTIHNGDILMSLTGNIGRVVEVKGLSTVVLQNYRVGNFYSKNENLLEKNFIKWILSSTTLLKQLERYSNQSAQANFGKQDLDKLKFDLPTIPYQRKIAKILTNCDEVIEQTEAAIAKYQALKQGMMQDLFRRGIDIKTGKLRPSFKDAPELYKESEFGMIPNEWEVKTISEIAEVNSGGTPSSYISDFWNGEILWITPSDLSKLKFGEISNSERKITENGFKNSSAILIPKNSLVISSRAPIGYCAIVRKEFTTNQGCKSITFDENNNVDYYYYNVSFHVNKIKLKGEGTTFAEISKKELEKIQFVNCNINEQISVALQLKSIDDKLKIELDLLAKYKHIKTGLMQDLLSGKVEVKIEGVAEKPLS